MKNRRKILSRGLVVISILWGIFSLPFVRIQGDSMTPTLTDKQLMILTRFQIPDRYDIVAFTYREELLVKRVIGMPGDQLIQSEQRLIIDIEKSSFETNYVVFLSSEVSQSLANNFVIPKDHFFVVGDNTQNFMDSRSIGFIHQKAMKGTVSELFYFRQIDENFRG